MVAEMVFTTGTHSCTNCGYVVASEHAIELPPCPACGNTEYRVTSMFEPTIEREATVPVRWNDWLEGARTMLGDRDERRLAYRDQNTVYLLPLHKQAVRIGRSMMADIRLDDPTVSRRHALLSVCDDGVRIFDDRSLNGIFVNGLRADDVEIRDGDSITIGRFNLFLIDPVTSQATVSL